MTDIDPELALAKQDAKEKEQETKPMATEQKKRPSRNARAGTPSRNTDTREIATHLQNSDDYINSYNLIVPNDREWKLGWFVISDPLPPHWHHVRYDELDSTVKHYFTPRSHGQLGNIVEEGGHVLAKIKRDKYESDLQRYDDESFVNMSNMIEGNSGVVDDSGSKVSALTLDG